MRSATRIGSLVFALALLLSGCVTRTDYYSPLSRPTDNTAYSLDRKETQVGVGVVGRGLSDFGGNVEIARGFGPGFDARLNLFQLALGAVSARLRYQFVDRPMFAMSAEVSSWWLRPSFLRILPADTRNALEGVDIFALPVGLTASVPLRYWGLVSLNATYHHSQVFGLTTDDDEVVYDGALSYRRFFLRPAMHFYLGNVVILTVGAELPAYAESNLQLVVTQPITPGIDGGIRTNDYVTVPFADAVQAYAGVETQFGLTHLRVYVTHGFLTRTIGVPVLPGADLYWRF